MVQPLKHAATTSIISDANDHEANSNLNAIVIIDPQHILDLEAMCRYGFIRTDNGTTKCLAPLACDGARAVES